MSERPSLRESFFLHRNQLHVYFYTSNVDKYLQARMLLGRYGIQLDHFRRTAPYSEDYNLRKQDLLRQAIDEIRLLLGDNAIFFVEDTSLRIEALSNTKDFPGLTVKEWFQKTSFEELDFILRERGEDRRATIKSDIALHLPNLDRPIYFYGRAEGRVALTPPRFAVNPRYPWLTPHSFNGWFIPAGATKRLGEMSFDESLEYDFRGRALSQLVERLEEYTSVLNLPPTARVRRSIVRTPAQLQLIPATVPAMLVIGPTCAGKTTMGEFLADTYQIAHIEASSIIRMMKRKAGSHLSSFEFARKLLAGNPTIVPDRIVEMFGEEFEKGFVITGFRTIEEIERLRAFVPDLKIVLVDSSQRIRFQRNLERCRDEFVTTFEEFLVTDQNQTSFGLLQVAEQIADFRIVNEGTIQHFENQIDALMGRLPLSEVHGVSAVSDDRRPTHSGQLIRCLEALDQATEPLRLSEIERYTAMLSRVVKARDANKILKAFPALASRDDGERPLRYAITEQGRSFLRLARLESGSAR